MTCFFISTATTVKTICKIAITAAAVFPNKMAMRHNKVNAIIATVVILPYVLNLCHFSDALLLILSAKDFEASDFCAVSLTGSCCGTSGTISPSFSLIGGGVVASILLPQYEQNFVSSDNSAPHFEHLIMSLLSFILQESVASC